MSQSDKDAFLHPDAETTAPDLATILHERGFASNPFPHFRILRDHAPVAWSTGLGAWVVSGYAEARRALQDAERFSNRGRITGLFELSFSSGQQAALAAITAHYTQGLINVDPPEHTRLRKVLHAVFRPSVIAALRPKIVACVETLLEKAARRSEFEFVRDFSHPLPVQVISELLGIPLADIPLLIDWSHRVVAFQQHASPGFDQVLASQEALMELRDYLRHRVAIARREGSDGVLALMATTVVEGDQLTEDEILGTAVTLINGGHETTTRFLASTLIALYDTSLSERASLVTEPAKMECAVEELLRFVGPFQRDGRVCRVDTTLGGQNIRAGDYIILLLGAANRDPRHFDKPEQLQLGRSPNKHLAFGYGPHVCLGAALARLETAVALRSFLRRWPAYRIAVHELEWNFGFVWGPAALPVGLAG